VRREQVREAIERDPESVVDLVMALQERIEELERRLGQDSRNSSKPPSSDPPKSRAERRREAREKAKEWSKRGPGGQPGHEGRTREMAPPERVDRVFEHLPERCRCGHAFEGGEERVGAPVAHQKWELPPVRPLVVEHRRERLACPGCGRAQLAQLPAGVTPSAFGPRLEAHIATLAGVFRLSRRQVRRVVEEMLGVPISTGAVDAAIMRMSEALADPCAALRKAVREADAVNADETGWRMAGAGQWLWLGASALAACYRIDPTRSQAAAKELLGEDFGGIVISDRYAAYHFLDVLQQQLCWCHVIRQLVELSEAKGATGRRGAELVASGREVIAVHRRHLEEAASSPGCAPSWSHCGVASGRCSSRGPAATTAASAASAARCWPNTRRCGPSARCPMSLPRTTPRRERSVVR
jgi:transposase